MIICEYFDKGMSDIGHEEENKFINPSVLLYEMYSISNN